MDVPSSISMENWESNDNFLIVREEDVGLLPDDTIKSAVVIEPGQTATDSYANVGRPIGLSQDVNRNDPHYTLVEQNVSLSDSIKGHQTTPQVESSMKTDLMQDAPFDQDPVSRPTIDQSGDISHCVPQVVAEPASDLLQENVTAVGEVGAPSSGAAYIEDVNINDESVSRLVSTKESIPSVESVSQFNEPVYHANLDEENRILTGNSVFTGAFVAADSLETMVLEDFNTGIGRCTTQDKSIAHEDLVLEEVSVQQSSAVLDKTNKTTLPEVIIPDIIADNKEMSGSVEPEENGTIYETLESHVSGSDVLVQSVAMSAPGTVGDNMSCIDLVLPVVDATSVTMADPLSLRPKKVSTSKVSLESTEEGIIIAENNDPIPTHTNVGASSSYTLPPHLMGRNLDDPGADIGPNVQKPRPGVKVPFRHLTSQIVTKDEIAQEYYDRSKINFPVHDTPQGGDIFFANKLTKRFASHITPAKVEKSMQKSTDETRALPLDSHTSGDDELLAILEGDVDTWSIDRPPPQLIEAARSPVAARNDPPKLDPIIERELALKQLSSMPVRQKKGTAMKPMKKYKTLDKSSKEAGSSAMLVGKRKLVEETAATKTSPSNKPTVLPSNGETISSNVDEDDGNEKTKEIVDRKAPRIFKTKRSLALTNGVGKVSQNVSKQSVSPKKSIAPTPAPISEPEKKIATDSNKMPNKQKEKTIKTVKKSKNNDSDAARILVSPPRTYSSRIKKSTYSDDFVFPSTSKSRVVPIVGHSSTCSVKLTKLPKTPVVKETPHVPKDISLVTPPVAAVPRKRGRPRIVRPATSESDDVQSPAENKTVVKSLKKAPRKLTEIDRLLMDEGAINMLYSVERDEEERRTGAPVADSPKKRVLKSARYSHRDLLMKTRLVKSAVQRLKNTPEAESSPVSLRAKRVSGLPTLVNQQSFTPQRKTSFDSNVSLQSPPSLTSMEPASPTQIFTYPPRLRPPAEASRIIRRHSSSSNFSSRSTSPNPSRRLSIDADTPLDEPSTTNKTRKRGAPIYITKLKSEQATSKTKKKKNPDGSIDTSVEDSIFQPQQKTLSSAKTKTQMLKNVQKVVTGKGGVVGKRLSTDSVKSVGKQKKGLTTCLAEAVTAFIAEDGNLDSSNVPPELTKELCPVSPPSPNASISGYSSLLKALEIDCQRRSDDAAKERSSPRQGGGLAHYKELSVRRHDNMVQVILAPVSTKTMNALNVQVLRELRELLSQLRKDDACRLVLLTATGSAFCTGVDFNSLVVEKPDKRRAAAQEMALAVKQFMTCLSQFNKPIIAGVHGAAVGLGVTMLPFFDMVFASDKATFYTPYAKLGQVPEGAAVLTLPQLLGNAVTSELLYASRKLTASEALQYGLVTRILWPDKFQEELLTLILSLANQSAQSMEATKALLRHNLRSRVDAVLESESQLLVQHWTSAECQANFKKFIDDEDIGLLRQRIDA